MAILDPYWSSVVLLCGFDGVDASTVFTDESSYQHVLTTVGAAQVDTAQSVFGGAAGLFNGTNAAITSPDSADWQLGSTNTSPWTVECWVRFSSVTGGSLIVGQYAGSGLNISWGLYRVAANNIEFWWGSTTSAWATPVAASGITPVVNQWYALCVDHDATGKTRLYIDGVMRGSATPANSVTPNAAANFAIGRQGSGLSEYLAGWVDEVRITKGVARYASDGGYTVPTAAFPRDGPSDARATQAALEQWTRANPDAQVTQAALEMWATTSSVTIQALATQAALEMWAQVPPVAPAGRAKVWTGSAWVLKPAKAWSGSAWIAKPVKIWNGSAWV